MSISRTWHDMAVNRVDAIGKAVASAHLTGQELALGSLVVAVVAIFANVLISMSANRNQRNLARDQYQRDNRTETYGDVLKGVHYRGTVMHEAFYLAPGQQSQLPGKPDSDYEASFGARLMAYGSPEVYRLWVKFDEIHRAYLSVVGDFRRREQGMALAKVPGIESVPAIRDGNAQWQGAKLDLVQRVRTELGTPGVPTFADPAPPA